MSDSPFSAMLQSLQEKEEDGPAPLSPEAQFANLDAAWAHYWTSKEFAPGDHVHCREGMSVFTREPVMMIFVRHLDATDPIDMAQITFDLTQTKWNKLDCMILRLGHNGSMFFAPFDQDILERVP